MAGCALTLPKTPHAGGSNQAPKMCNSTAQTKQALHEEPKGELVFP